jgi:hypothetical protein
MILYENLLIVPNGMDCIVIESDLTKEAQDLVVQEAARQSFFWL